MAPPTKKSKRLSRKDLQQLKDYGELDPLSSASGGNDLDELISRAMSKNGSHRQAEVKFSTKKGRERHERRGGRQQMSLPKKEKGARPDAYSRLLKSLGGSNAIPAKRTAIVSDDEDEDEEAEDEADTEVAIDSDHAALSETDSEDDAAVDSDQVEAGSDDQDEQEPDEEARSEDDLSEEEEDDDREEEDDAEVDGVKEVFELKDYFAAHVADDDSSLAHKKLAAATQKQYKQVPVDDPALRNTVLFDTSDEGIKERNPRPLKQRLVKPFHKLNNADRFTDYQASIFNWFDQYRDVVYAGRTIEHDEELTTAYALHAVNHVLKSRDRERKNNARLAKAHATGKDAGELRDRGFTRPRVLVILPFRNSAYRFVEKVLRLLSSEQEMTKTRFEKEFGPGAEDDAKANRRKPADYQHTFAGNIDDAFRIGIQLRNNAAKLYAGFYASDIIVASPIGLRMTTGAEKGERRDFDFLSSIEVLIVDNCDTLLMQNWDHVMHMFTNLNRTPKKDHGCDFSRIRNWYLDGASKYRRQTIMISDYLTPEVQAVFANHCQNIEGKVRIKPSYAGAVTDVVAQVPQIFKRLNVKRLLSAADDRFAHFAEQVLPDIEKSAVGDKHTLIFVPSYFDFVRIRNYCKERACSFAAISEYSTRSEAMRARMNFYDGKISFILYSERAHFFHRYPIKGIHNMVFYGLPDHPLFYSELVNLMLTSNDESAASELLSCTAFFTKYDQLKLERVVGTRLVTQLLTSEKSQYTFA